MRANLKRSTLIAAYLVAIGADLMEIVLFPIFSEGFASLAGDFVDVMVCIVLVLLVGWHIAFLPSFLIKVVPIVDFAPTWTLALLIATRNRGPAAKDVYPNENREPEMKRIAGADEKPPKILP
jgi:hypothetical protein